MCFCNFCNLHNFYLIYCYVHYYFHSRLRVEETAGLETIQIGAFQDGFELKPETQMVQHSSKSTLHYYYRSR